MNSNKINVRRSFIFTPGLKPEMFPKAISSGADMVCIELEDGIAIKDKNEAEGTEDFNERRNKCATIIAEEYQKYLQKLKERISSLKKGSKQWWKLNRELLQVIESFGYLKSYRT